MQKIKKLYRSNYTGEELIREMQYRDGEWVKTGEFVHSAVENKQISGKAVVLGNGPSRLEHNDDLFTLLKNHKGGVLATGRVQTYGCNAVYRDYEPTFLIATGKEISAEIADSGFCDDHIVYANSEEIVAHPGKFYLIPQDPHFNAGALAAYIAAFDGHEKIYMVGFDLQAGNHYYNNVYANTNGYHDANTDWRDDHMVQCLEAVMQLYPDVEFIRVMPTDTWVCPGVWRRLLNFRQITFDQFHREVDL